MPPNDPPPTPLQTALSAYQRALSTGGDVGSALGTLQTQIQSLYFLPDTGPAPSAPQNIDDTAGRRVRLRAKPGATDRVYGGAGGLMYRLIETNGMVFPYQPAITYQQDVTYTPMELVHTNQDFHSYTRTPALKLSVDGQFTVQSQKEGLYAMACIHFLRSSTKMWFGGSGGGIAEQYQGTPPPVLLFDAYGEYMFNALPVIITQFSVTLPNDVDYVPVKINSTVNGENYSPPPNEIYTVLSTINETSVRRSATDGYAWLPALFNIQVQLMVQNTPRRLRAFDLSQFRDGSLLRGGTWV
jgi:peptidoglycan hydrolase-like protein with peptidoglycan-binding domain